MISLPTANIETFTTTFPPPYLGSTAGSQRGRGGRSRSGLGGYRGTTRSEFSSARGQIQARSNTAIVVENIPAANCTEDQVRTFFGQFGEISEVTMHAPQRIAIVKYSTSAAARAALTSPKAIFDNRFVKVYWLKAQLDLQPDGNVAQGMGYVKEEGEDGVHPDELEIDMESFTRKQELAQERHAKRVAERAELSRKKEEIDKQLRELAVKQAEQMRRLQEKLAQKNGASKKRDTAKPADVSTTLTTSKLRAQLAALEAEAKTLGIDTDAIDDTLQTWDNDQFGGWAGCRGGYAPRFFRGYRGYSGGAYRGRGNMHGSPYAAYCLDNRPKVVAISGADFTVLDKYEALRHYLMVS